MKNRSDSLGPPVTISVRTCLLVHAAFASFPALYELKQVLVDLIHESRAHAVRRIHLAAAMQTPPIQISCSRKPSP